MTSKTPQAVEVAEVDRDPLERVWSRLEAEAGIYTDDEAAQCGLIGVRDGFSEAIQLLDMLTGGDGEYRFCLGAEDSDRHCPTPVEMGNRIIARTRHRLAALGDWRGIETAPLHETIDLWVATEHGEGWRKTGELVRNKPQLLIEEDGGRYSPHENGGWFSHWRPLPAPPESDRADG